MAQFLHSKQNFDHMLLTWQRSFFFLVIALMVELNMKTKALLIPIPW